MKFSTPTHPSCPTRLPLLSSYTPAQKRAFGRALVKIALVALPALLLTLMATRNLVATAQNTPGALDPTFDTDGKVVTSFPKGLDIARDVALQADGKIVVAGSSGSDFALARYNADGSLDTTFGTGGRVHTDFPLAQGGFANALVIQPDGKIVLAGSANSPDEFFSSAFALARYNPDGSLDTSFDSDGLVITSFPGASADANDLVLQPDGKLVVAGTRRDNTNPQNVFALARYNADGSLDNTFDSDGRATVDIAGGTFEEGHGVGLQADGRIVVVGLGNSVFAVARLNANGSPDNTFDTDGQVTTELGEAFEQAQAVAFQTDGRIVVAGQLATSVAANMNFGLVRYNTDGSLDNTFDSDGKVIVDFGLVDAANDLVIQTDGKIVAVGSAGTLPNGSFFALARLNTTGSLDTSFDGDGKVLTDNSDARFNLGAQGVVLQPDGKIVVAGDDNSTGQSDFGVYRYNTDGSLDASFDGDGKTITDFPLNDETIEQLLIQPDGKIVAVGRANPGIRIAGRQDLNFQLARYNPDGSLDTSFGTGGLVSTGFARDTDDFAYAAALQPDGKIVVAGQTGPHFSQFGGGPTFDTSFGIARYNADGSLDSTFGTGGLATVDFASGNNNAAHDSARAVAIQPDGKIVLAGSGFFVEFKLARLNPDGSLDSGTAGDTTPGDMFGTGGKVTTDFGEQEEAANAVLIQPDGKIVAAGISGDNFALARYNPDGSLDTTGFGTGGKVTTDFAGGLDAIKSIVLQPDGKIVAGGDATTSSNNSDFALARYNTNGSLDTTNFGTGGKVTTDFGGFDAANDIALQADGRIVAAGLHLPLSIGVAAGVDATALRTGYKVYDPTRDTAKFGGYSSPAATPGEVKPATHGSIPVFALARYDGNGSPDSTFGTNGTVTTDFFGVDNEAFAVVIQADGRVVAGGYTDTASSRDFALARYIGAPATVTPTPTATATPTPISSSSVEFEASAYLTNEGAGRVLITVVRTGNTPSSISVDYATDPDADFTGCEQTSHRASERCDFTTTLGTLRFAADETRKTFSVFITDDAYDEGEGETFQILLSNPSSGLKFGTIRSTTVIIEDNDSVANAPNPIDNSTFFVKMHYVDFLNREGEPSGVAGWVNSLDTCASTDPFAPSSCDRIEVSSRFFRSVEFMLKGSFVIRFYRVSLGLNPRYREFTRDSQRVTGQTAEEVFANRNAFTDEWVERADFRSIYDGLSNQAYVDKLEQTAGVTLSNKAQLVADLDGMTKTRAQVLREIVESNEVRGKMYNDSFVLMEYFGYLRRDPEETGFNAWLAYLDTHPGDYRTMVRGFVNSVEYRKRFGNPGPPQPGQSQE
ncbi:MAG TPA: Calx-beta domain-containing protein [Pyrinomonadaceae bacterium]|nr:Calx-beta domain-containing protein [Pyrinomonadaceae bacterium]